MKSNATDYIVGKFRAVDSNNFPSFQSLTTPLEMGLWVLLVAKESKIEKHLSAEGIADIIREIQEVSVNPRSISNAFNRSAQMVHVHRSENPLRFEIMKSGKDLLESKRSNLTDLICFEPGKPYKSKRILSESILGHLKGDMKIVDPYCGERTLDILSQVKHKVELMTKLNNLSLPNRTRLVREIADFKTEHGNVEIRDYTGSDIHDRYIISENALVILGHSIKDLGGKESIAVALTRQSNQNIIDAMLENFNRRWKTAVVI